MGPELVIRLNMDAKIFDEKDWFNWVGRRFEEKFRSLRSLGGEPCGTLLD